MHHTNTRGRLILEMSARTGFLGLNSGGITTFRHPGYTETIPDISYRIRGDISESFGATN